LPEAKRPSDLHLMRASDGELGPSFANSLAGDEIGARVTKKSDLKIGDLVLFADRVAGYTPGVITHVGIYAGNGNIVDRGSAAVHFRSIETFRYFFEGRRPNMLKGNNQNKNNTAVIDLHNSRVSAKFRGRPVNDLRILLEFQGRSVVVNDKQVKAKSVQAELRTVSGYIKIYAHDNKSHSQVATKILAKCHDGTLHVHAGHGSDLKEVRVLEGRIEIVL
jgi:hypothetical protein